eukprot:1156012-Pelagomonas_calceolata.AAC.2
MSSPLMTNSEPYIQLALPFWTDPEVGGEARKKLAVVLGLTLGTTGVRVLVTHGDTRKCLARPRHSFKAKNVETQPAWRWLQRQHTFLAPSSLLLALLLDEVQLRRVHTAALWMSPASSPPGSHIIEKLKMCFLRHSLWRAWMTEKLMSDYFDDRTFYTLQSEGAVDNPDQRISSDVV